MFGAFVRAAPTAVVGALFAAILSYVLAPMMEYLGPEGSLIHRSFASVNEHALLIIIGAILLTLLGRAIVESRYPGGI